MRWEGIRTASQRTSYTKRRKQIWEALHPEERQVAQAAPPVEIKQRGHAQDQSFAAATAEATGQSKATTNRAIARADALGEETLAQVANTSLDSGVELDALAKLDAPERVPTRDYFPPSSVPNFRDTYTTLNLRVRSQIRTFALTQEFGRVDAPKTRPIYCACFYILFLI